MGNYAAGGRLSTGQDWPLLSSIDARLRSAPRRMVKQQSVQATEVRNSAISGACAGFVSSVVTCPLDVIKTRLQVPLEKKQGVQQRYSVFHNIKSKPRVLTPDICSSTWHAEGVRGFYRGLGPTVVGYLPTWAIYFVVYDTGKEFLSEHSRTFLCLPAATLRKHPFAMHITSAMVAGATSTTCTSPMWVVKTRVMLQTVSVPAKERYRSTLDAFIKIYRNEGVWTFYKGLLPSLLGVFHVVVQFPLYEYFKSLTAEAKRGEALQPSSILICSGGSKMLASLATYPHEVLRTRLQMQQPVGVDGGPRYTGFIQAVLSIARHEGIHGFYRGMLVNLVRTVPNSGLTILTYVLLLTHSYELLMHYLSHSSTAS